MSKWLSIVLVLLSVTPLCAQSVEEVIKVDVALVTVNVSVTDARGRSLSDLKAADFVVTEQGKPMRVEFFESHGPASIVFVIDLSSSMKGEKWRQLKAAMKKFLTNSHSGNDYTLVAFSDQPSLIAQSVNENELWQLLANLNPSGNTALYDAVLMGLSVLDGIPQRHKAMVLFSDGEDNSSRATLAQVEQEGLKYRATIYTVGILHEFAQILANGRTGKDLLNELAIVTAGLARFPALEKIQSVLEEIRSDLTNRYSLSYYPGDKAPGWRRVEVSITPRTYQPKLRYQQQYLVR